MLVIRLFRAGKKHQPFFKIVVTDKKRPPRGGRFVEELGFLNPLTKERKINGERAKYWVSKGAQPSDTVYNLLVGEKVLEGKKIPVHKKSKKAVEDQKAEVPAGAETKPEAAKAEEKPAEPEAPKQEENSSKESSKEEK